MRDGEGAAEKSAVRPFPWQAVLHAGLFLLRLPPELFWRLSLPEFAAMTGGFAAADRIGRGRLGELMARFPDGGGGHPSVVAS